MTLQSHVVNWRSGGAVAAGFRQFYCAASTAPPIGKTPAGAVPASGVSCVCRVNWRSGGAVVAQWRSRLFVWVFTHATTDTPDSAKSAAVAETPSTTSKPPHQPPPAADDVEVV